MLREAITFIGGAALSGFLDTLFGKLFSLLEEKLASEFQNNDYYVIEQMESWKYDIEAIQLILEDAEEHQQRDAVGSWLQKLEHLAYDMEDIVDLFTYQRIFAPSSSVITPDVIADVGRITKRLKRMTQTISQLGLIERINRDAGFHFKRRRSDRSHVTNESSVYGREEDKRTIIEWLKVENEGIGVIPIVGMGGLGKTTLARYVFNDDTVKQLFQTTAWVCVSQDFDLDKITRSIVEAVTSTSFDLKDLSSMHCKLAEELRGKKILLVLDDLWNKDSGDWLDLVAPLKIAALGSKIIVTTRNSKVADAVRTTECIRIGSLTEDDCWLLFCMHAYRDFDKNPDRRLERIGKEIVKKCRGLPLAVRTMGGVLRLRDEADLWEAVLENKLLISKEGEANIMAVLRLSYNSLPPRVKRCFAFCAVYPEDHQFDEGHVSLEWWGAGLVPDDDAGRDCFSEMVQTSLLLPSNYGFVMHDLVRDLAKIISKETCCVLDEGKGLSVRTRHLSLKNVSLQENAIESNKMYSLRTFLSLVPRNFIAKYSSDRLKSLISNMRFLRVLSVSIQELPESTKELVLLRQLDVRGSTMSTLPESISCLRNLEILDLGNCLDLTSLPEGIGFLSNMSCLKLNKCGRILALPSSLKELKKLKILTHFIVGKENGSSISSVGEFRSLKGGLIISNLENVASSDEAKAADLHQKSLRSLTLKWKYDNDNAWEVIEALRPPENLERLKIISYPKRSSPSWFPNLVSLTELEIQNCPLLEVMLPRLPSLLKLTVAGCSSVDCHDDFSLKNVKEFHLYEDPALSSMFQEKVREGIRGVKRISVYNNHNMERYDWIVSRFTLIGDGDLMAKALSFNKQHGMHHLPPSVSNAASLTSLQILCCNDLKTLSLTRDPPPQISTLIVHECADLRSLSRRGVLAQRLEILRLFYCPNLDFQVEEPHRFLVRIEIVGCPLVARRISHVVHNFVSLSELCITGCAGDTLKPLLQNARSLQMLALLLLADCDDAESFPPEEIELPAALRNLSIEEFSNLKRLNPLRGGSLQRLTLRGCPHLQAFSGELLRRSIEELSLQGCEVVVRS